MIAELARTGRRARIVVVATVIVAASAGYLRWQSRAAPMPGATASPTVASVPAGIATVARHDVPVYLSGLGTVQAFNTVTIKTRVDGELQKVAFTEGQEVKAGDLLAKIDPRPFQATLDQAVAKKTQDEAQLANAKLDLTRFANLATRDYATKQQLDTQRALVAQLEAQIEGDQASIDSAQTQLDYTTITSPLAGRTGIRLVDQGNIVHATDTTGLVVVTQLQPISVIFTLPEDQLASVKAAMAPGPASIAATTRDGKRLLAQGTLALVDNEIDQSTGTIRLKGTFANRNGTLWPGEFVNVRLLAQTAHNVVTIPSGALQRGPAGYYAYVVKSDGTVEMRPLQVGQIDDDLAVVDAGVDAGEKVVTSGQYRLRPGARVVADNSAHT
ncbi:MAG: efflux transporter periplasmic adaptor subunit [Rhodospirillales bacterium]|jgi:multidrug efflux system membrane fusion protein|nr:efflux transporter periplasmic adaptor subunit [Rhodospirillales bacterium]